MFLVLMTVSEWRAMEFSEFAWLEPLFDAIHTSQPGFNALGFLFDVAPRWFVAR